MKELHISDFIDDICPDEFGLALEEEPVSTERVWRILRRRGAVSAGTRYGRRGLRMAVRVAIAAALVLTLSVTAWAVGSYTGFFEAVFGGPDAGEQSYELPVDEWDENGERTAVEITVEGEPVDQDKAQALLGDKVAAAQQSITVGDYTCTVEDIAWAENGVGVMTYSIENPKGLPAVTIYNEAMDFYGWEAGETDAGDGEGLLRSEPFILPAGALTSPPTVESLFASSALVAGRSAMTSATDTRLEGRMYFVLAVEETEPEALDVYFFRKASGEKTPPPVENDVPEEYRLTVPLPEPAKAVELTAEGGWTASVSPMGLALTAPGEQVLANFGSSERVIHFADGSEYVMSSTEPVVNNIIYGFIDGSGVARQVFNRLVEPEAIQSITISGSFPAEALYADGKDPATGGDICHVDLIFK